ncbi:MAG: hypothetical protein LC667_20745 [Thioalkalivibrio sp.]|nr:hypothetical protein [Thioalkalivibrio sp.]
MRQIYSVGVFPADRDELLHVSHAIRDATEFIEISDALPPERLRPLAVDLQAAVAGGIGQGASRAAQYQTQLWIGAMLAYSGSNVGVLLHADGKNPDFVATNGTLHYAIEVKRPSKFRARRIISEANDQITARHYHGGAIIVDLTDCIPPTLAVTVGRDPHGDDRPLKREAMRLTRELNEQIYDYENKESYPTRAGVFGVVTMGRTIHWDENDRSRIYLQRFMIPVVHWGGHRNTLRGHRAQWLTKLIQHGVTTAGSIEIRSMKVDL